MGVRLKFKRVLITGGAGFIGSHLSDSFLSAGCAVKVLDNLSSGRKEFLQEAFKNERFSFAKVDLLEVSSIARQIPDNIDLVCHLAANPDISKGIYNPSLDYKQTVEATFHLLKIIKQKKIKNLLYSSGSGVYGDKGKIVLDESYGSLLPVSMYGASKLAAESLIYAFSHLYGIKVWVLRPANITGIRATHGVVFDFIKKLRSNPNELLILGDGKQSKSYLYISDFVRAINFVLEHANEQINLFNVTSTTYISVNEIAEIVIKAMGLKIVKISHSGGKMGWPGDVAVVRLSDERLKKLGWRPEFTSRQAVEKTVSDLVIKTPSR